MLKIWWIWKIEIWSEEVVDGYQTVPYQPGALFGGGQLSGSFQSILILTIPFQYYFKFHSYSCVPPPLGGGTPEGCFDIAYHRRPFCQYLGHVLSNAKSFRLLP